MKTMTAQMSSSVRYFSQTGMVESQGVPSTGNPGPPFAIRQNKNVSANIGMTPGSMKLAGTGFTAAA